MNLPKEPSIDITEMILEELENTDYKIKLKYVDSIIKDQFTTIKSSHSLIELKDILKINNIRTFYYWFNGRNGIQYKHLKVLLSLLPDKNNLTRHILNKATFYSGKGNRLGECKLPLFISPELSYFVGYFIADGSISKYGNLVITDSSREHLQFISSILSNQFKISKRPIKTGAHRYEIQFCSIPIRFYLTRIFGLPEGKKKGKTKIPEIILNENFEILRWFIIGFQDGDAYKPPEDDKHNSIMLWQSSLEILKQIYKILLENNIDSYPPRSDGRGSYYIYIPRKELYKYLEKFPFMHPDKMGS